MPSIWDLIKEKSSIDSGTTYEHLVSEIKDTETIIVTSLTIDRVEQPLEVSIVPTDQTIEISELNLSVELLQAGIDVEVDITDQEATIQETTITVEE